MIQSSVDLLSSCLVSANAGAGAPQGGGLMGLLPMILLMVGMWFLFILPQRRKQKEHQRMLQELKAGDNVVMTCGVYGTITAVQDDRFVVRIADNTRVEVMKAFVQTRVNEGQTPARS